MNESNKKILGILPNFRGNYDPTISYNYLNEVFYGGSTFRSKVDNNTNPPCKFNPDGTYEIHYNWQPVAIGSIVPLDNDRLNIVDAETKRLNDILNTEFNNIDNTSDLNKPISTATKAALDSKVDKSLIGSSNGLATLDSTGVVPTSQLNPAIISGKSYKGSWDASTNTPNLTSVPASGFYYIVSKAGNRFNIDWNVDDTIISNGTAWEKITSTASILDGKIVQLEQKSNTLIKESDIVFDKKKYTGSVTNELIGSNGWSSGALDAYQLTEWIKVDGFNKILFTGIINKYVGAVTAKNISGDDKIVLYKVDNAEDYNAVDVVVNIPPDITHVRGCCRIASVKESIIIRYYDNYAGVNAISALSADIYINNNTLATVDCKGVNTANGELFDNSSFQSSDFIFVKDATVRISNNQGEQSGVAGYDINRKYISRLSDSSTLSVIRRTINDNDIVDLPDNIYYIKASTSDKINNPLSVITEFDKNIKRKTVVSVISPTEIYVNVWNQNKGEYITHTFQYVEKSASVPYGSGLFKTMVCQNGWYGDGIFNSQGGRLLDGNYNFIYKIDSTRSGFTTEGGHVGITHGCELLDWVEFYSDGELIDLSTPRIISCDKFEFVQVTKCVALNKPVSPNGDNGYPLLDINGNTTLAALHYLRATLDYDNRIQVINRLIIKRDNTAFDQIHAGMVAAYYPYFDEIRLANYECTRNRVVYDFVTPKITTEVIAPSEINIGNRGIFEGGALSVYGGGYYLYQESVNNTINNSDRCMIYSPYPTQNRYKFYNMPCVTTETASRLGKPVSVFNNGDIIECVVKRIIQ